MSGRLLLTIADQHLRPARHAQACKARCAKGCPIREYDADMDMPVLPSEIAAAKAEEERMQALARGDFSHLDGGDGDEAGQAAH